MPARDAPARPSFRSRLAASSRIVAYGRRPKFLVGAILFPLPLLLTAIGDIALEGWSPGAALWLAMVAGIWVSMILYMASPLRYWWALRITLGIIVLGCAAWILREILAFREAAPVAPRSAWTFISVLGAASLYAACRPRPDIAREQLIRDFIERPATTPAYRSWPWWVVVILLGLPASLAVLVGRYALVTSMIP